MDYVTSYVMNVTAFTDTLLKLLVRLSKLTTVEYHCGLGLSADLPVASFDRQILNDSTQKLHSLKAVFHFNRIIAKRSVFNCVHIISSA